MASCLSRSLTWHALRGFCQSRWLAACLLAIGLAMPSGRAQDGSTAGSPTAAPPVAASNLGGPLRIVKLLWKTNPKNAAGTLERSIATAVARQDIAALRSGLAGLASQTQAIVSGGDRTDVRYAVSLAASMLIADPPPNRGSIDAALHTIENSDERQLLWQVWLITDADQAYDYLLHALADAVSPARPPGWQSQLIPDALAADRPRATKMLIEHWDRLNAESRLAAIEPLTANVSSMKLLVNAVKVGTISKDLINTNQLRKWLASDQAELAASIEAIWGRIRKEDDAARQKLVAQTLARLESGVQGSVSRGAAVFDRVCSQCHQLHGRGFEVGPNIVGNGRGNLQQLVSNILDPSLVIGEAFQSKTVLTVDGEVVSGLVVADNDRYLKLKIQGGKIVEFNKQDIEQVKASAKSLMPEGVETQMQEQELFDLLAYLSLLKPLDAPDNELIPGTPADFVQP